MLTHSPNPPSSPALTGAAPNRGSPCEGLLQRLAQELEQNGVPYCQWKGHWSAHRWATGHGDIDLLVHHAARTEFRRVVEELGFKLCQPAAARQVPATEHYLGRDPAIPRVLHLHIHYQLVLGDFWKPIYRLPIEEILLRSVVAGQPFKVPAPTHQYLVFVLRMMLRQVGRPLLSIQTLWTTGIRIPLGALEAASDQDELAGLLAKHLSPVDPKFFQRCVRSLQGKCGWLERAVLPWELHRRLRAHVRRPSIPALLTAAVEKLLPGYLAERVLDGRVHIAGGGAVVALVGGHATSTSTCARELGGWLASAVPAMQADLGNPPSSLLTLAIGCALKLHQCWQRLLKRHDRAVSRIELLRQVCTARDRYRLYVKVRRYAMRGGIAICEGYPVVQNRELVGPRISDLLPPVPDALAELLCRWESSYYERILGPDAVLVLRLRPEIAVTPNPAAPGDGTRTLVVDASQPVPDLIRSLKGTIWSLL